MGADLQLITRPYDSFSPSVSTSGQTVHVVWSDNCDFASGEIYYKRSADNGLTWEDDLRLTNNSADSWNPSIAVSGSMVHVVWMDTRDGNRETYYKRSLDGGASWGMDTRLTNDPAESWSPSVAVSGSIVHVVWYDMRDFEIYYKRSSDGGISWSGDIQLTNNFFFSIEPSIAVSGQFVHVVWNFLENYELYYKRSTDGGVNWENNVRLTNTYDYSRYPNLAVSGQLVHVVWTDRIDGNNEIYYKRSINGGSSWEADTRLTNNSAYSEFSSIAVSNQTAHVVWQDYRDGNYEIYYKNNPSGNSIGLININSEIPNAFSLSQNYPNPFNPSTKIRFDIPSAEQNHAFDLRLVVYDILGREIAVLVNQQLKAGTYEVGWDASNYPSGVYLYKLQAAGFVQTKRMMLVK